MASGSGSGSSSEQNYCNSGLQGSRRGAETTVASAAAARQLSALSVRAARLGWLLYKHIQPCNLLVPPDSLSLFFREVWSVRKQGHTQSCNEESPSTSEYFLGLSSSIVICYITAPGSTCDARAAASWPRAVAAAAAAAAPRSAASDPSTVSLELSSTCTRGVSRHSC